MCIAFSETKAKPVADMQQQQQLTTTTMGFICMAIKETYSIAKAFQQ